jgi:hypothetical protein
MDIPIFFAVISLGALLFFMFKGAQDKASAERESRVQAAARCMENLMHRGVSIKLVPTVSADLDLRGGEEIILTLSDTNVCEPRPVRISHGSYLGSSVRIAKGLYLHSGSSRGVSESHDELRTVDNGILSVTNQRIIFIGPIKTISTKLEKVLSVKGYKDGIRVHLEGKGKPELFIFDASSEVRFGCGGNVLSAPLDGRLIELVMRQFNIGGASEAEAPVKTLAD